MTEGPPKYLVNLQPIGRRVTISADMSLLNAAQSAGVELVSLCGGIGACDSCKIRLVNGKLSPPTLEEQALFSPQELAAGYRLACQAYPRSDVKLDIPPESLTTPQRLQIEGQVAEVELEPSVWGYDIELPAPSMEDLRSDSTRLIDALINAGMQPPIKFDGKLTTLFSQTLRENNWKVMAAVRGHELIALLPPDQLLLGLAIDVGTTKLAAYLVDLTSGQTLAKAGAMNPQIGYGEDVISRISYANHNPDGRKTLQVRLIESLDKLINDLCEQVTQDICRAGRNQIVDAVVVGNTAMHHLFAGLPVHQLGTSPYVPSVSEALDLHTRDLGWHLAPGTDVYLPPNIAGYVGADHVAVILATGIWKEKGTAIALDIGTNTEVSLAHHGRLLSLSCASGPAFEGAHIQSGMRAAPGAIERVQLKHDEVLIHTIGEQPAVGLCGSGILDTVSEMLNLGVIDQRGALLPNSTRIRQDGRQKGFLLVPAHETGHGRDILITRHDINEIQLAKGAIRTGINILLSEAGIDAKDLDTFIVAGAFGTYIDIKSAIRIGMFPDIPLDRYQQVGNAAGAGARQMLLSTAQRTLAQEIARNVEYIELGSHPSFADEFSKSLFF